MSIFAPRQRAPPFPQPFNIDVPSRPAAPSFSIDYTNERTVEAVGTAILYTPNTDYSNPVSGAGAKIALTPGKDLYLWVKSTASSFASMDYHLVVPDRPAAPSYSVDYSNENTNEIVTSAIEYSPSPDLSGAVSGTGSNVAVVPGSDYYFRVKPTSSSFASGIFHLPVVARPVITTAAGDTVNNNFTIAVDFHKEVTGFAAADMEITNARADLTGALTTDISPFTNGYVTVRILANAVTPGNFASSVFKTYYKKLVSAIPDDKGSDGYLILYPSGTKDVLHVEVTRNLKFPVDIMILNSSGALVMQKTLNDPVSDMDLNHVSPGLYVLKAMDASGKVFLGKVVKQ